MISDQNWSIAEMFGDAALENWTHLSDSVDENTLDLSYLSLDSLTLHQNFETSTAENDSSSDKFRARRLYLYYNRLDFIPENIRKFRNLKYLDISSNNFTEISETILQLKHLSVLIARNNFLEDFSLPKKICMLQNLEVLNLSGNLFKSFPVEVTDIQGLKSLYLGGNQIEEVTHEIRKLERLEVLYLGGNNLRDIPAEMGRLLSLKSLILCENQLQSLPSTISCLRNLRSLALHKNQLTTLPPGIVTLQGLVELSLRDNPLVVRFVQDLTYDPPALQELAARCVKLFKVPYSARELPHNLLLYLQSACRCVNPKCKGVYFDNRVEHIKFVDFCGKYRIPLLQYLCSPRCSISPAVRMPAYDSTSSDEDGDVPSSRLKQVLLG